MIRSIHRLLTALAICLPAASVIAADFPTSDRPITVILGFPAGGGMDGVARALQPSMEQTLGTKIIIDYRTGAGGNIASQLAANARPDGHTLLLGTAGTHGINATLYKRLPFDVEADFTPIAPILDAPNVLAINPAAISARNVKEFIELVKANPGKYNYASTGYGTSTHLAFADFAARAGLEMVHVPFKGGPDAMMALMRGDVCCIFTQVQLVLPHAQAGKVQLLGVSTLGRVPTLPEVPTIAESAIPGFENSLWFGLFGPKGMDPAAVKAINQAVKKALETPSVRQRLADLGNTPRYETPEAFRATVHADRAKWAAIVKASGATID